MTRDPKPDEPTAILRLPAAVIRFWIEGAEATRRRVGDRIAEILDPASGFFRLAPDQFGIAPAAGDPAPFDTALAHCRELPDRLARAGEGPLAPPPRMLITPGEVLFGAGPRMAADPFAEDFATRPPDLEPGRVYLTGWAANVLEQPHQLLPAPPYEGPSGRSLPMAQAGGRRDRAEPWRNPSLLGRRPKGVPRHRALAALSAAFENPAILVTGPIGSGKTRLLWQALERRRDYRLWLRCQPERRRGLSLAAQIARQLAAPPAAVREHPLHPPVDDGVRRRWAERAKQWADEGDPTELTSAFGALAAELDRPLFLVCDDIEQLAPTDRVLVEALAASSTEALRLVLAGRAGALPESLGSLPTVRVDALDEEETTVFSDQLFAGLSLPAGVRERLLEAVEGYPFALEEGMIALIREKSMRRIYGSFFFGGSDSEDYRPSLRLVCHLQSEAARLADPTPIRILSLLDGGAPAPELAAAASILDREVPLRWEDAALESGLLRRADTPWGAGLRIACRAYAQALGFAVPPERVPAVRHQLGQILSARSPSAAARWSAYSMARGTPEAVPLLLRTLDSAPAAQVGREELLDALTEELRRHRDRGGDAEIELRLLWPLLPVARRLGRLHQYAGDLARGVELAREQPSRLLALAGMKAELDQEAGRYQEAEDTLKDALKAAKGTDERRQTLLLIQLGRLLLRRQRYGEAGELFRNLGRALEERGGTALAATCEYYLGNIALHEKRFEDSLVHHRAALSQRREQNLLRPTGYSLSALGAVWLAIGNYPQAIACYREAQELLEAHGRDADVSYTLMGLGKALTRLGDYTTASQPLRRALTLRRGRDDVAGEAIARLAVAENYLLLGQPETAHKEAREAHFRLNLVSVGSSLADAEQLLGRIRFSQRQFDDAREHLHAALERHKRNGNGLATGFDLAWLLDLALAEEDEQAIRRCAADLNGTVAKLDREDLGEWLDLRLFRSLEWLRQRGRMVADPLSFLDRAYREVLRKAAHLEPEQRHRYLSQIAENQAIVDTATRCGLSEREGSTGGRAAG